MSDLSSVGSPAASPLSDEEAPVRNGNAIPDDSDEDVTTAKQSRKHVADDDDEDEDVPMGDGDLFGDNSGDEDAHSPKRRKLSDAELDSGDDLDRRDRMDLEEEEQQPLQEESLKIIDYELNRHGIPQGSDGEFYLLKFPGSVGIEPKMFAEATFEKPTKGHHGAPPGLAYSAAQVSNSTIRWRRDPQDPAKLQSNARILRWSDGSLTIQIGSMPFDQFELPAKALAPAQSSAPIPTPISQKASSKHPVPVYNPKLDTHTYLASIHPQHNLIGLTNHITAQLSIHVEGEQDAALLKLQEDLQLASKAGKGEGGRGPEIVTLTEDPELARKRAEAAEKERARADRRRINQQEKERDRATGLLGPRSRRSGGLTLAGLEDDDDMGIGGDGRSAPRRRAKAPRKPRRRNSEYSDDEEEGYGRRGGKEDEYDENDGFLVGSDEEIEVGEGDSDEDEFGDGDGDEEDAAPAMKKAHEKSGRTGRRGRAVVEDDSDD